MKIDPSKLPKAVLSRGGKGKLACIDTRIYVSDDGFVTFSQKPGIEYPAPDAATRAAALEVMVAEARKIAR